MLDPLLHSALYMYYSACLNMWNANEGLACYTDGTCLDMDMYSESGHECTFFDDCAVA